MGSKKLIFQNAYVWLILLASLDIMCTWIVLWHGGREMNGLAARFIRYGPAGLVVYKFLLIVLIISLCEIVGRRNMGAARILIGAAIGLNCIPVLFAAVQLLAREYGWR